MSEPATLTPVPRPSGDGSSPPFGRAEVAPYARPHLGRSLLDLATSVVPYLALSVAMYFALDVSYLLVARARGPRGRLPAAHVHRLPRLRARLVHAVEARQHLARARSAGCSSSRRFRAGATSHAVHHATAGDLDRRGVGDVPTLTVAEYHALPWRGRLGYRLFRNPLVMFGLGPIYSMMVAPRWSSRSTRGRASGAASSPPNVALAVLIGGALLADRLAGLPARPGADRAARRRGRRLAVLRPASVRGHLLGERASDWSYTDAALRGSSYLKLPKVLQFFTGNIGLHHVHHLSARIPNYNLQRAHDENPIFHDVPTLSLLGRPARGAAEALGRGQRPPGHLRRGTRHQGAAGALSSATPMS